MTETARVVNIGVLALQGAYKLHKPHIIATGAKYLEVISKNDLKQCDGLIIPGGESGVMLRILQERQLLDDLKSHIRAIPVWGICAGAILLAKEVLNPTQESLGMIDATIKRNGYGRQLQSMQGQVEGYDVSYIRAPIITHVGSEIKILSKAKESPTWIESNFITLTTFHPELNLSYPSPWHQRLTNKIHAHG